MKYLRKQSRRLLGMLLSGCLLAGGMPLTGSAAAQSDSDIRLEAEADEVCVSITTDGPIKGQFEKRKGDFSSGGFSGGYTFVNVTDAGGQDIPSITLTFTLRVPRVGVYDLSVTTKDNADRGIYTAAVDGETLATVDFYNAAADFYTHPLGRVAFESTTATLTLTCAGANKSSNGKYGLAADYITLSPATGEEPEPDPNLPGAPVHTMTDMYACTYTDASIQSDPLRYRLYIPADYTPEQSYPLLVYLNGAGSRGTDNKKQLDNLAPLINPLIDNKEYPCIVAVPQLPGDKQWVNTNWTLGSYQLDRVAESVSMKMLMGMIAELQETYAIDDNRLYLMGQSFGGYGTWDAIMRYPNAFAAAIPMCGAGDPSRAEAIRDIPLLVLHGNDDGSVPVTGSREMAAALKQAGSTVTYLEYEGDDHYIQRRLFEQPEIWMPWLFAQERGMAATQPNLDAVYQKDKEYTFNFNSGTLPSSWNWTGNNCLENSQLTMTAPAGGTAMGILKTTQNETDGMISAFITIDSEAAGGGGLVFRYQDEQNYGHVRFVQKGLELLEMVDGKVVVQLTEPYTWVPGRIACLKAVLKGNRVTVTVDNDPVFDTTIISPVLCGSGAAGLRYYNGRMKVDDFIFGKPPVRNHIILQDFADRQVIQRNADTKSQRTVFAGNALVEGMERLELSVVSYNTAQTVVDWTPVETTPQTGDFKVSVDIPQGGWYRTLLRAVDKSGRVLVEEHGNSRWGIGINILCIGQSNMVGQGQDKDYIPADDRVSNFKNEIWSHLEDPYAAGDTSLVGGGSCGGSMVPTIGNILIQAYDLPVGFIPAAQNGASLMAENNGWLKRNADNPADRGNLYGNSLYRAQTAGGIEFIIMNQGENDVSRSTDAAAYQEGLSTLIGYYQQDLGYEVPLIYCQLGPAMAGSWDVSRDPYMSGIRSAQARADNGKTLIMGATEMDLERNADNLHYTSAAQEIIGQRIANAVRYYLGDAAYYKGPEIIGASFAGKDRSTIYVTVKHYGGDDFTPAGGITGFEVFADGDAVGIAAARRKDRETIELTLETTAQGQVTLRYLYGCLPDVSGLVKDNSPLQLPLCPTNGVITVNAATPDPDVLYGDLTGDGRVDSVDALVALQAATGKISLTAVQAMAADVDGQDGISAGDALLILQYATKKIRSFPVGETNNL